MQYWNQNEVTNALEPWFQDNDRAIPTGQDLVLGSGTVLSCRWQAGKCTIPRIGFAISRSIAASRWQTYAHRPMKRPDSPDKQARGIDMHKQNKQEEPGSTVPWVAPCSPHSSMKTHEKKRYSKMYGKPNSAQTASAGWLQSWLQGDSNTRHTSKVHHDMNNATPCVIVLAEAKLSDARQDRVSSRNTYQCSTAASWATTIVVHNSLTSHDSVELIHHNPAAKSHLKSLIMRPLEGDCLTVWGVYLASDDPRRREELYQVIQHAMSSENDKASHAGLPLPYTIMAGDMNAALCNQCVQRLDTKDAKQKECTKSLHQVMQTMHQSWPKDHSPA